MVIATILLVIYTAYKNTEYHGQDTKYTMYIKHET